MKNKVLRALLVVVALAAFGAAGYVTWMLEQRASAERSTADTFERQARQLALGFTDLRAAFQAFVADGQNTAPWLKTAADLRTSIGAQAASLHQLARTPDAEGALQGVVESIAALGKTDQRAREFLESSQRLTASDIVFGEAAPLTARAIDAIDVARGHESVASAATLEHLRVQQLYAVGGAALVALVALLILLPLPTPTTTESAADTSSDTATPDAGLGIGHIPSRHASNATTPERSARSWPAASAASTTLSGTADVCAALARVQEPRELPALLERAAHVLNAAGIVVWMPDLVSRALKPALAYGYAPHIVTRMGTIPADADNATAVAFRTAAVQTMPADEDAAAAVAAPLVTADGCSGVLAAELKAGADTAAAASAAAIMAAQLATLISPSTSSPKDRE
jgi:hypothetical protein